MPNSLLRPVDLVLFDVGSTLLYEKGPWPPLYSQADAALWAVLQSAAVRPEARSAYGQADNFIDYYYATVRGSLDEPTSEVVLRRLLAQRGHEMPDGVIRAALRAMYAVTQANWEVEGDAIETLEALKEGGILLGAVSNGADLENTQALIDKGGLRPYLQHVVSSGGFGKRKPDPGIFQAALNLFGVRADQAVMVGDDYEADILGAQGVGMQAIWITRRAAQPHERDAADGPDAVISALNEIPRLLERGQRGPNSLPHFLV